MLTLRTALRNVFILFYFKISEKANVSVAVLFVAQALSHRVGRCLICRAPSQALLFT